MSILLETKTNENDWHNCAFGCSFRFEFIRLQNVSAQKKKKEQATHSNNMTTSTEIPLKLQKNCIHTCLWMLVFLSHALSLSLHPSIYLSIVFHKYTIPMHTKHCIHALKEYCRDKLLLFLGSSQALWSHIYLKICIVYIDCTYPLHMCIHIFIPYISLIVHGLHFPPHILALAAYAQYYTHTNARTHWMPKSSEWVSACIHCPMFPQFPS